MDSVAAVRERQGAMVARYQRTVVEQNRLKDAAYLARWAEVPELVELYAAGIALAELDLTNIEAEITHLGKLVE